MLVSTVQVSKFVFAQQSLQPKLWHKRYASVSYALQNNTVFRRAQNWVSVSDGSQMDNESEFQSVVPVLTKMLTKTKTHINEKLSFQ